MAFAIAGNMPDRLMSLFEGLEDSASRAEENSGGRIWEKAK